MDKKFGIGLIVLGAIMMVASVVLHGSEIEEDTYMEDNSTGLYYKMNHECELFSPTTGEILSDDNETKCEVWMYINGVPTRLATPDELDGMHRGNRERMY